LPNDCPPDLHHWAILIAANPPRNNEARAADGTGAIPSREGQRQLARFEILYHLRERGDVSRRGAATTTNQARALRYDVARESGK